MRKLLQRRPRPESRPQRVPIPQAELDEIWRRAQIEAIRLIRITV